MNDNMIEEVIKKTIKEQISKEVDKEIQEKVEKFADELTRRKDDYISQIMKGIRIQHERDFGSMGINYRIIFENYYKLEK